MELTADHVRKGLRLLPVRYEDLVSRREDVLDEILVFCGLPAEEKPAMMAAFDRPSQQGTHLDPTRGRYTCLSAEEKQEVWDLVESRGRPVLHSRNIDMRN
jgi:hypothetical protein